MNLNDSKNLIVYQEILNGYSEVELGNSLAYIKHIDTKISSYLESVYYKNYVRLQGVQGMKTEAERLKEMCETGEWSQKEEDQIQNLKLLIDGLHKSKIKHAHLSRRRAVEEEIKRQSINIEKILQKKRTTIGPTIEDFCNKKKTLYSLYALFFKDEDLRHKLFQLDELDYEDETCSLGLDCINSNYERINDKVIQAIGVSTFFINQFLLAEEDVSGFFGMPVAKLSINQSSLAHYGKKYIEIFREVGYSNIPLDKRENPEKLVEWFEVNKNAKDLREKGIVGGTNEDKKALGIRSGNNDIIKMAEKKGSIGMYEFNDMFGNG